MTRRTKIWLFAGQGLLAWFLLVWALARLLELEGSDRLTLVLGLGLLGIIAAAVLVWYFLRELRDKEGPPPPGQGDEIDNAIATARARLVTAKYAEQSRLSRLPMVVTLGAVGSAKTTIMLRSGLDPDLLAGEVQRGDATVATRVVNLWYSSKTIFLEVGGKLSSDGGRFTRLIKHLQPSRLAAVLSAGSQAPRVAIVCLSIEDLTRPGGAEQVMTNARELRARLLEISQRLGIRLPVYVMFTKADRIPYFTDFVRNFSQDEAREVFGTTLPFDTGSASTYGDRTSTRVTNAMQKLAGGLAIQRLQYLPRETQPDAIYGGYEFAREFRKLIPLATQFLVELCRPSQLEVSPVLRGFYFTGVRAIIVDDGVAAQAPVQRQADPLNMDATQAFVPAMYGVAQAPTGPVGSTSRKVPQWVFLGRFFKDVVLKDRVALAATGGGAKVNLLRRAALATVTAVTVIFIFGMIISFARNRKLIRSADSTVRSLISAALPPNDVLNIEALQRLDTLRAITQRVSDWEREGSPLGFHWGLYSGKALYARLRSIYFIRFDSLMYQATFNNLSRDLRNMPQIPFDSADYPASYDLLKAYIITTSRNDKSTPEFLGPVLTRVWGEVFRPNEERTGLALPQFSYFASELAHDNPLPFPMDTAAVRNAQAYLKRFGGEAQIYQIMRADANRQPGIAPFDYAAAFPAAAGVVQAPYVVEGAFTRRGWNFMQDGFKNIEKYFSGEDWVSGTDRPSEIEIRTVTNKVRDMYLADYIKAWQTVLAQAKIAPLGGVADAARKMNRLGGNPSPLMQLFNQVSLNVAVDSAMAASIFLPVRVVSPPDSTQLFGEKTDPYLQAVLAMGTALEQVASAPPGQADGPVGEAKSQAATAKNTARNLGLLFGSDPRSVGPDVSRLLLEGINRIDPLLGNVGIGAINKSGGDLCSTAGRVLLKAPFNPNGTAATLEEVNAFFNRTDGALVNLFNSQLNNYMVRQGNSYVAKPGSSIKINPRFRDFFTRAMQLSAALYPEGQPGPRMAFTFRALLSGNIKFATFTVDGTARPFSVTRGGDQGFTWIASESQEAKIEANVGGNPQTIRGTGAWSVFQLFAKARNWKANNGRYSAEFVFTHDGGTVVLPFELNLLGNPSIFDPAWLRGLSCVSQIGTP
jgi:type VI secretion system protein ImpL